MVQPPDGEVQHGGEADPGQIRHQQPAGDLRAAEEGHCRRRDRHPEDHDLDEGPAWLVHPEEDPRPGDVQGKLDDEQRQRYCGGLEAFRLPDQLYLSS